MKLALPATILAASILRRADAAGCSVAYSAGTTYEAGSVVTAPTTKDTTTTTSCTEGTTDCVDGTKTVTTSTTTNHNYKCQTGPAAQFCSQPAFYPGGPFSGSAWTQTGVCTGAAGSAVATGCVTATMGPSNANATGHFTYPQAGGQVQVCFDGSLSAASTGATVTLAMNGLKNNTAAGGVHIYTGTSCATGASQGTTDYYNATVGDPYVTTASSTISSGATYTTNAAGVSTSTFKVNSGYGLTETTGKVLVVHDESVANGGDDARIACGVLAAGELVTVPAAWTGGTGCPARYAAGTDYAAGATVSVEGTVYDMVYECAAEPTNKFCGQSGFSPGVDVHWEMAWDSKGSCTGSGSPTASPAYDPATGVGGCRAAWVKDTKYNPGDVVSVEVSASPVRKVSYECLSWPLSDYCAIFGPTEFGGNQGWKLKGSCNGEMGPTASPAFVTLTNLGGCPDPWSASSADSYTGGTLVSVSSVVFECKAWPFTAWCKQGEPYKPDGINGGSAWTLKGGCSGTMSPTRSPSPYAGVCQYTRDVTTVGGGPTVSCNHGSTGCSCTTSSTGTLTCTKETDLVVATTFTVNKYSSTALYVTDDVIRLGTKRFKCKPWPFYFWCRVEAYEPTLDSGGIWSEAWLEDGVCPGVQITYTTTTNTATVTSSIELSDVNLPTSEPAKTNYVNTLKEAIKTQVEASLAPGESVQNLVINTIGGNPINMRRRLIVNPREIHFSIKLVSVVESCTTDNTIDPTSPCPAASIPSTAQSASSFTNALGTALSTNASTLAGLMQSLSQKYGVSSFLNGITVSNAKNFGVAASDVTQATAVNAGDSRAPTIKPTDAPSRVPSLSLAPTASAVPSMGPTSSAKPSTSVSPSITQLPSLSLVPSTSSAPSKSASPSTSVSPSITQKPSMSLVPSKSLSPSKSVSPSITITPSLSLVPSKSVQPSESAQPSSL